MIYEICVDSVAGVRAAKAAGADRVELCADLLEGGITPSRGMIRQARTINGIGLHVIIRPRGGDFLFDDDEFAIMQSDIETAKAEGADGVVIGLLTAAGEVDTARTTRTDFARPTAFSDIPPGVRHDAPTRSRRSRRSLGLASTACSLRARRRPFWKDCR